MDEAMPDFLDTMKPTGPAPEKKTRKKRKVREKPEAAAAPAKEVPKKRGRKPRSDKQAPDGTPKGAKVDLAVALHAMAGLKAEDAKAVTRMSAFLAGMPKRSRTRIVAALSHIFA